MPMQIVLIIFLNISLRNFPLSDIYIFNNVWIWEMQIRKKRKHSYKKTVIALAFLVYHI